MSANVTLSVTESVLYQALGDVLRGLFVDSEIRQGQQNRTSLPVGDFIIMTTLFTSGLSTTATAYSAPEKAGMGEQHVTRTTQWTCQIDFFGPSAADRVLLFATLLRSEAGVALFSRPGAVLVPLYTSEPRNLTFINDAMQYEPRWSLDFTAQINPVVTAPLAFFDNVAIDPKNTEATNDGDPSQQRYPD